MILDILAVQRIVRGADIGALASGGQTFGFNCNVSGLAGQYFDFTVNSHPVITIWDGGTNNTLDLSGYSADSTINLAPGTFSSCNGMVNNIGIADGTIINHAVGGAGNDKISGSASSGVLRGGGGNDFITATSNLIRPSAMTATTSSISAGPRTSFLAAMGTIGSASTVSTTRSPAAPVMRSG